MNFWGYSALYIHLLSFAAALRNHTCPKGLFEAMAHHHKYSAEGNKSLGEKNKDHFE